MAEEVLIEAHTSTTAYKGKRKMLLMVFESKKKIKIKNKCSFLLFFHTINVLINGASTNADFY